MTISIYRVINAIQAEPEFPGDMPDHMWEAMKEHVNNDDRESVANIFRQAIEVTKLSITKRVTELI